MISENPYMIRFNSDDRKRGGRAKALANKPGKGHSVKILQPCTICGKSSIPGIRKGAGKCQYHWNCGQYGKKWADTVERKTRASKLKAILNIAESMGIDGAAFDIVEICKKELG